MDPINTRLLVKKFEDQIKEELSKMAEIYNTMANRYTEENTKVYQTKSGQSIEKPYIDISRAKEDIRKNSAFWNFVENYEEFWNNYQKVLNAKNIGPEKNETKDIIMGYAIMAVFVEGFHNGKVRAVSDFVFLEYLLNKFGYNKEEQATIITVSMRASAISNENRTLHPDLFQTIRKDGSFNPHFKVFEILVSLITQVQDYEVQKIIFDRFYNESISSHELDSSQKIFLKLNYQLGLEILEGLKIVADYLGSNYEEVCLLFLRELNDAMNERVVALESGMILKFNSQKEKILKPSGLFVDKMKEVRKFINYVGINFRLLQALKDCKLHLITTNFGLFAELFEKYQNFSFNEQAQVIIESAQNLINYLKSENNEILESMISLNEILSKLSLPFDQDGLIINDNNLIKKRIEKLGFSPEVAKELIIIRDSEQEIELQNNKDETPKQPVTLIDKTVNYANIYISKFYDGVKITAYVDDLKKLEQMLITAGYEESLVDSIIKQANSFNHIQDEFIKEQEKVSLKEEILSESEKELLNYCTNILENYFQEYLKLSENQKQIVQGFIINIRQNPEAGYSIIKDQPENIQKAVLLQEIKNNLDDLDTALEMYLESKEEILLDEIATIINLLNLLSQTFALTLPKESSSEELYNIKYLSSVLNDLPQKMTVSEKKDAEILLFKLKNGIGIFDLPTYDGKAFYKLQNSMCVYYARGKDKSIVIIGLVKRESKGFNQYDKIIGRKTTLNELSELQTIDVKLDGNAGDIIEDMICTKTNNTRLILENTNN